MRCLFCVVALILAAAPSLAAESPQSQIERGRYLAIVGGCNDCHTRDYTDAEGEIPERWWLRGSALGFRGIWGTTPDARVFRRKTTARRRTRCRHTT